MGRPAISARSAASATARTRASHLFAPSGSVSPRAKSAASGAATRYWTTRFTSTRFSSPAHTVASSGTRS